MFVSSPASSGQGNTDILQEVISELAGTSFTCQDPDDGMLGVYDSTSLFKVDITSRRMYTMWLLIIEYSLSILLFFPVLFFSNAMRIVSLLLLLVFK